jgi:hypothetical protein
MIFWQRYHSIATESRREFVGMQEELAKQTNGPNIEAKIVRMSVLGVEKSRRQTLAKLRKNEELEFPSNDRNGKTVPLADVKGGFSHATQEAGITNFRFQICVIRSRVTAR